MSIKRISALAMLAAAAAFVVPASASAASVAPGNCVTVIEGGDIGERFCINDGECLVSEYRTTFLGTERYCIVPRPVDAGEATSSTSGAATRCVATYAAQGGKYGSKYCVDTEGSCTVSEYRTTIFGTAYYCYVSR